MIGEKWEVAMKLAVELNSPVVVGEFTRVVGGAW